MSLFASILNSIELLFEAVRNLHGDVAFILPVKEHLKQSTFPSGEPCGTEKDVVCLLDLFSKQNCVVISYLVVRPDKLDQLVRSLIQYLINLQFIQLGLIAGS